MRLNRINPDAISNMQSVVINDQQYNICLYFEAKHKKFVLDNGTTRQTDNYTFLNIPWSNVRMLTYTDSIGTVGLTGSIIIDNEAGAYNYILKHQGDFYLCFHCLSKGDNTEENIIFSIVDVRESEKNKTSSNNLYKITMQEAFAKEAASKSFATMNSFYQHAEVAEKKDENSEKKDIFSLKNLPGTLNILGNALTLFAGGNIQPKKGAKGIDGLVSKIGTFVQMTIKYVQESAERDSAIYRSSDGTIVVQNDSELARILTIDGIGQSYFNDNYPSVEIASAITADIDPKKTCLDVLQTINDNFYSFKVLRKNEKGQADVVDTSVSEKCYIRSENMTLSGYIYPDIYVNVIKPGNSANSYYGERMLTFKNIRTVLYNCFKNNRLMELFISPDRVSITGTSTDHIESSKTLKNDAIIKKLLPVKTTLANFDGVKYYPPATNQTYDMWGDLLVIKYKSTDNIVPVIHYPHKQLVGIFNNDYLNNSFALNLPPDLANTDALIFKKSPYGKDELRGGVAAETLASYVYLNEMLGITMPGRVYRRACEMVYIDEYLNTLGDTTSDKPGEQKIYNNLFRGGYHFVCEVTHRFFGNKYSNNLLVSSFGRPIYNSDPSVSDVEIDEDIIKSLGSAQKTQAAGLNTTWLNQPIGGSDTSNQTGQNILDRYTGLNDMSGEQILAGETTMDIPSTQDLEVMDSLPGEFEEAAIFSDDADAQNLIKAINEAADK